MSDDMREIAEACDDCEVKPLNPDESFFDRAGVDDPMDREIARRRGVSIDACSEHDPEFMAMTDKVIR